MKKSLLLGAMALATSAATNAASAATKEYGFYTLGGSAYCDGLELTGTKPAVGYHIYDQVYCVYQNATLGGFDTPNAAIGPGKWFTLPVSNSSGDGNSKSLVFTFYANVKSLLWVLYYESSDYGIPFSFLNQGTLQAGPPFAMVRPGAKHLGSVIHEALAALKK